MTAPIRPDPGIIAPIERDRGGIQLGEVKSGRSFQDTLSDLISDVSESQDTSQNLISKFIAGEEVEMHQLMSAMEEASLSLEMLVEIRNKLSDAYRTIMNMQA